MNFRETLNDYFAKTDSTQAELARVSGLSGSTISRYRSGERTPSIESRHLLQIADGFSALAKAHGIMLSVKDVYQDFRNSISDVLTVDYSTWLQNLVFLLKSVGIKGGALSRAIGYDSSSISKILSGSRKPANISEFTADVSAYAIRVAAETRSLEYLASLVRFPENTPFSEAALKSAIIRWLGSNEEPCARNPIGGFLEKLDHFNLDDYIRAVNLDDVKLLTLPNELPNVKLYSGKEGMFDGEIDFIRATLLSHSTEDVLLYSDFPALTREVSMGFFKLWMVGMSLLLKRGLHLDLIVDINKPLDELAVGIEGYLPLIMTGQINIYYLKSPECGHFCHSLRVSGAAVLVGFALQGNVGEGRFTLSKRRENLRFFRRQVELLRSDALPLMEVYRENRRNDYMSCLDQVSKSTENVRFVTGTLPFFAIPEKVLLDLLKLRNVSEDQIDMILKYRNRAYRDMTKIVKTRTFTVEYPNLTEEAFREDPICLMLSDVFFPEDVPYTYEAYDAHRKAMKEFAETHPNLVLISDSKPAFRNLTYSVVGDDFVIISKNVSPAIHFCIRNAKLAQAVKFFIPPIKE